MSQGERFQYILRNRQTSDTELGTTIGLLDVLGGKLREETNRSTALEFAVPVPSPYLADLIRGRVVSLVDKEGEFEGDFIIDTVQKSLSSSGARVVGVSCFDHTNLLASHTINSLKVQPERDETINNILGFILEDYNALNITPSVNLGTIDATIGAKIRSINIENDSAWRALLRLREMAGGYLSMRFSSGWLLDWTAFPVTATKRLLVGHNVNGLSIDEDGSEQANLIRLFGRGQDETRVFQPTVSVFPDNYWPLNDNPHDVTENDEHMTEVGSPTYTGPTRSTNLVTNKDFKTKTDWVEGANWTINQLERLARHATGSTEALIREFPDLTLKENDVYEVWFSIFCNAGSVTPSFAGVSGTAVSTTGTYRQTFTVPASPPAGNPQLVFTPTSTFDFFAGDGLIFGVEFRAVDTDDVGAINNAVVLNGSSQYLYQVPSSTFRRDNTDWAVELWYNLKALPSPGGFWSLFSFAGVTASTNNLTLGVANSGGNVRLELRQGATIILADATGALGIPSLETGVWHRVSLNRGSGGLITCFDNCLKVFEGNVGLAANTYTTRNIGGISNAGSAVASRYFNGIIDDVRLYESAITSSTGVLDLRFRLLDNYDNFFYEDAYVRNDVSIDTYGLLTKALVDKSITHPDTLYPLSKAAIEDRKDPVVTYQINSINVSGVRVYDLDSAGAVALESAVEDVQLNEIVNLFDPDFDLSTQQIVVKRDVNLSNPRDVQLDLSNVANTIVRQGNEVFDTQGLSEKAAVTTIGAGSVVVKGVFTVIDIFTGGQTTIDGGNITANTVTADKINVNELSAIDASIGQLIIERGDASGDAYIRTAGATAFETGVGFWLGEGSGNPTFFIGDSSAGANLLGTSASEDFVGWTTSGNWATFNDGGNIVMRWSNGTPASGADTTFIGVPGLVAEGVEYTIRFEIKNYVRGSVRPQIGGEVGPIFNGDGLKEARIIAGGVNDAIEFVSVSQPNSGDTDVALDIDNIYVQLSSSVGSFLSWDTASGRLLIRGDLSVGNISAAQVNTGTLVVNRVPYQPANSDINSNYFLGREEDTLVGQDHNPFIVPWYDFLGNIVTGGNKRLQIITNKPNVQVKMFAFYNYANNGGSAGSSEFFLDGVKQGSTQNHSLGSFSGNTSRTFTIASAGGHNIDWCFYYTFLGALGTFFEMTAYVIQADADSDLIVL